MPGSPNRSAIQLAVVTPMANEGAEAVRFTTEVLKQCSGFKTVAFYAVIDRATKDDTLERMRALELQEPRLKVVWAPENRCVVDAYLRGYREALAGGADWILEIDAGFSHQPTDIPRFFDAMEQGYDCVFGSRFTAGSQIEESALMRKIVSWGGTTLTNLAMGTSQTDMTSGFELFTRRTLERILANGIHSRAHFFQTEIKVFCRNFKIVEVPITYRAASPGLGSKAIKDAFSQLFRLFQLRLQGKL